jgi:hypothetical protein
METTTLEESDNILPVERFCDGEVCGDIHWPDGEICGDMGKYNNHWALTCRTNWK